jgi:PAS domain S-box-containing protein
MQEWESNHPPRSVGVLCFFDDTAAVLPIARAALVGAFDEVEEGCLVLDHQQRILLCNEIALNILGVSPPSAPLVFSQLLGQIAVFDLEGRALTMERCPVLRTYEQRTSIEEELLLRRADGSSVHLRVRTRPLVDGDRFLGVLAVVRDRTREVAQERRRQALRRLSEELVGAGNPREVALAAYHAAQDLFDLECFILDWYDAPTRMMHPVLLIDQDGDGKLREFPRDPLPLSESLQDLIRGKALAINRRAGTEYMSLRPVGSGRRAASLLFAPLRRQGETVGLVSVQSYTLERFSEADLPLLQELADLTGPALLHAIVREELESRRAEEARHARLLSLEKMAAGISHNFNNLLTGILGYADLLASREDLDASAREMLDWIRHSAEEAAGVVRRLQEFYRSKGPNESASLLDLGELVQELVYATRPRWFDMPRRNGVTVEVLVEVQPTPPVRGQRVEILNGLTELLFNAVEAMPRGGTIRLSVWAEPGEVVVTIADTGVGMPPEVLEHCFEPFFLSKAKRGSGLGLAAVHGMVARHGGRISVQSVLGQGTTFTLRFPAAHPAGTAVSGRTEPVSPGSLPDSPQRSLSILAIDDEPLIGKLIETTLVRHGYRVQVAEDGQTGLDLLAHESFDLVITDLGMPHMDGFEVARRIKQRTPSLPVVLLTGWAESSLPLEDVAVDAVLQKPIGVRSLVSVVQNLVRA